MHKTHRIVGFLVVIVGLLAWPRVILAPPPAGGPPGQGGGNGGGGGGGNPPAGTVYFRLCCGEVQIYSMAPDGSNKTALPGNVLGDWVAFDVSRDLHGDRRWFLSVRNVPGEFYPYDPLPGNGIDELAPRREIFAVRDDGDELFTVQLTDQPDLEIGGDFFGEFGAGPGVVRWGVGDLEVSWVARRWDLVAQTVVEGGIYVTDITFDGAGNVVGLVGQPVSPLVSEILVVGDDGILEPDIGGHDWAPDGSQIVYKNTASQLVIADLVAGTSLLPTENPATFPVWSPDGSRIAFQRAVFGGSIVTITVDGSQEKVIVKSRSGGNATFIGTPQWAPTGNHILYSEGPRVLDFDCVDRRDVFRATDQGKSKANLTTDLDTTFFCGTPASPMAWRDP